MNNSNIPIVEQFKLLLIIDRNLNFINHSKYVICKATKILRIVRPTWGAQPANVETIYHRAVVPIITYLRGRNLGHGR